MATVNVRRTDDGFEATNERGARVAIGSADEEGVFSPWSCCWRRWAAASWSPWSR